MLFRSKREVIFNGKTLKKEILRVWDNIEPNITRNLVDSMRKRCEAVIAARGGTTKY